MSKTCFVKNGLTLSLLTTLGLTLALPAHAGNSGDEVGSTGTAGTVQTSDSDSVASGSSTAEAAPEELEKQSKLSAHYFGILYGPALKNGSSIQPNGANREEGKDLPLSLRNFASVGYALSDTWGTQATATWDYIPVRGQELNLRDPYVRISNNSIFSTDTLNLYGDVRFHIPVTTLSRDQDILSGIQTLAIMTYIQPGSRWTWALYGSSRYNVFGKHGRGNDLELYLGPNFAYQITPSLAFTTLYEMNATHHLGQEAMVLNNDGTDLEPGFRWDVTPKVSFNPYVNIYTGNRLNLDSTSVGATLSWQLL
ncbi:MAG: hypothetical protein H7222_12215 [Methylotenera sp.]|nr:hypothetical protein [Oligoflexia bacterium]